MNSKGKRLRWHGSRQAMAEHEESLRQHPPRPKKTERRRTRKKRAFRQRVRAIEELEGTIRQEVAGAGLRLEVSTVMSGNSQFPHWRFVMEDGFVILHYWPTNGTYLTADGVRDKAVDPIDAMGLALNLVGAWE